MESRYERARAKIAESYTDMNDQIAGGRNENNHLQQGEIIWC